MPRPRAPTRELFEFTNKRRAGGKCDLYRCRRCGREMLENTHRFAIHISICKEATEEDRALAQGQLRKTKKYAASLNKKPQALPEQAGDNPVEFQPRVQSQSHQVQYQQPVHQPQVQQAPMQPMSQSLYNPESQHRNYYRQQYSFGDNMSNPMTHRQNHHYHMFRDGRPAALPTRQSNGLVANFQAPWGAMFPSSSYDQPRGPMS